MGGARSVSLGSDGHCTGFPDGVAGYDWTECCLVHDTGTSDGQLLDCVSSATPDWAAPLVALACTLMILFRPVYNKLQKWGWVK